MNSGNFADRILTLLAWIIVSGCLAVTPAVASVEDFIGEWEIQEIRKPGHARNEIKYPVTMIIARDGNGLKGSYTDQFGEKGEFSLIATSNEDRDLIFIH